MIHILFIQKGRQGFCKLPLGEWFIGIKIVSQSGFSFPYIENLVCAKKYEPTVLKLCGRNGRIKKEI